MMLRSAWPLIIIIASHWEISGIYHMLKYSMLVDYIATVSFMPVNKKAIKM